MGPRSHPRPAPILQGNRGIPPGVGLGGEPHGCPRVPRVLTEVGMWGEQVAEPPKPCSCSSSRVPSSCFSRPHLLAASSSCDAPKLGCSPLIPPKSGGAGVLPTCLSITRPRACASSSLASSDSFSVPPKMSRVPQEARGAMGGDEGRRGLASSSRSLRFSASSRACRSPVSGQGGPPGMCPPSPVQEDGAGGLWPRGSYGVEAAAGGWPP